MNLADLRKDYTQAGLTESDVSPDPFAQFGLWFDQAVAAGLNEPNAMTLATATPDGRPSARIVLLKGFDSSGFVFFTSYAGRKGRELERNPRAALVFFWGELERQARVEGEVRKVSREESDAYFQSRPSASRLSAWASPQSQIVSGREWLEARYAARAEEFADGSIPLPPDWGGYRLVPSSVEFWQGRPSRLHDRILYRRSAESRWKIERLAP
jgi:pyridoxamine 5'-phosphate oxidase